MGTIHKSLKTVSCAAATSVLKIMNPKFLNNSLKISKYLFSKLETLKTKHSIIKEIRGIGLIIGIDLTVNGKNIVSYCLSKGLIINCTHDTVLRLLPALIITKRDVDTAIKIIDEALTKQA